MLFQLRAFETCGGENPAFMATGMDKKIPDKPQPCSALTVWARADSACVQYVCGSDGVRRNWREKYSNYLVYIRQNSTFY